MTLSAAFNIISSSFAANSARTAVVANNIANVNTPGYSRQVAGLAANSFGGADLVSVTRIADAALAEQVSTSTAQAAAERAIAKGLAALASTVDDSSSTTSASGADQSGASPSAMLANLQSALTTYADSPTSSSAADAAVTDAQNLARSLNAGDAVVNKVREQADRDIASSVSTINSLLSQFETANDAVVSGLASGANVSSAEDTRDSLVTRLAEQIGVTTTTAASGSMSIYTDSGVTLFQDTPRTVSFAPTSTYVDGDVGAAVAVDGVPITGAWSPMPIQSGALAGYAALRDTLAPQYEAQLDQIAGGLIDAFAESDQADSSGPALPGLYTSLGATGLPSTSNATGLAAAIEVNPAVDPSQGGDSTLLRDGGINGSDYVYNATGASSYTTRLQQLVGAIASRRSFDASAGLETPATLPGYASASVSWLQGENSQASNASDYQNALASQATSALSNATGVNLDSEMTDMLNLENTYASTAKLLTTVTSMFSALLDAA
jgi:flagellar hook-associated protein 1 FlgK